MRSETDRYARVYATVNLDHILFNMESMKRNIDKETQIMAVVKTDGYGHGAVPIAKELEGLEYLYGFAVATAEEAHILRESGILKPILILGYTFPYCYEMLAQEDIRPTVFREDMLEGLSAAAAKAGKRLKVHLKVDTGMSRIGIFPDEQGMLFVKKAMAAPEIEVEGIFTHFAASDHADKSSAVEQMRKFKNFCREIREETGITIPVKHCSNSAGIIEMRDANMDVVRAGITLYGLWPSDEVSRDILPLRPAMELKSHIVHIKDVEAGTPIGYGHTYTAEKKSRIATIPVGYGDGYPRGLSNKGYVLVRGQKAPVRGRICMDQFMADVTSIPEAGLGDEVTLLGRDGTRQITMEELSELSGRFNYELACCLTPRVPRIYVKDQKIIQTKDHFHDYE